MTVVRVLVFGAGGRMGATVCEAVAADDDLELAAGVDPGAPGQRA
ncbi:MAG: 4-hydroxy-tetrahydrodipicolinate reductase, partial [Acidimicrobiales bacterium]|nr:4-hydroxy-tetrahydrodipicolinate reductase [Acidimicrobiales bacterium]